MASLDLGPVAAGYVGVLVIGQFLIAVGLLTSAMTKSQVMAALMSFALVFLLLIVVNWMTWLFRGETALRMLGIVVPLDKFFKAVSSFEQMEDFARGLVDVRPLVLYASGTGLVLFLTTRILESRKWR